MKPLPIHILSAAVLVLGAAALTRTAVLLASVQPENYACQLEYVLPDMQASKGNSYGGLYTLDGKSMTKHIGIDTTEDEKTELINPIRSDLKYHLYVPTEEYYASAVGVKNNVVENNTANGLLNNLQSVLSANVAYSNRQNAVGDTVITTIVSGGQKTAYEQLQDFQGSCRFSSLSVVGADGAILVNVSSNCKAITDYDQLLYDYCMSEDAGNALPPQPDENMKIYHDFGNGYVIKDAEGNSFRCEDAECVGSSFKTITARILQQNNALLPEEFSVYNSNFIDVPEVTFGSEEMPIRNHDYSRAVYPRTVSLGDALAYSSNTYFLRHVQELGLEKYMQLLSDTFWLDSSLNTDTHTIPGMPFNNPNRVTRFAEKVTYGQEAVLTTIRLAALYNHALSGKCYQPFDVAEVRTPDNSIIYHASPQETEELHMDIDMTNDIVVEGLQQTFSYYTACYPNSFSDYSYQFIHSGRLLAKSGTADMSPNPDNHTMAVTLLDESRQNIICTGVIAVNYLESDKNYLTTEAAMAERLLAVFDSLGVIPHE